MFPMIDLFKLLSSFGLLMQLQVNMWVFFAHLYMNKNKHYRTLKIAFMSTNPRGFGTIKFLVLGLVLIHELSLLTVVLLS